jgi:hypothetical protein
MNEQLQLFSAIFTAADADESGLLPDHPNYDGMILYPNTPASDKFFQAIWAEYGSGQYSQWRCEWPQFTQKQKRRKGES